jgi:hypothetical protein
MASFDEIAFITKENESQLLPAESSGKDHVGDQAKAD